ncbi:enamine deaminase RidA (YjgF/YER057c/UK114 family) [Saccharopolyspora phatthalungensis]|uniref:Enamine deaminase RidA (YjgF/YER057c/UK114 family) n=2 Tax=Saccharopolyspora phatthalungensis TaxID=664693 RepID=A0A840QEL9_9PSEU|nr:enamine deaminase RidA (YjgF/YER057c/UK114 family) [Saccharopolyspora phatthalungensis]
MPEAPEPAGDYATARVAGGLVFTAGMTPRNGSRLVAAGRLGADLDLKQGKELAALAAQRAIAAAHHAAENAGVGLAEAVSLTVYLATTADFTEHTAVADGASERVAAHLGGPPAARAAIGVHSLPSGAPVEVSAIFAVSGDVGENHHA